MLMEERLLIVKIDFSQNQNLNGSIVPFKF